jgi:DNA-binding HxlR family transcriptional regulator
MWEWGKRIREETKGRILRALAEKKELSFNQLARETKISRRILAERLRELKAEGKIVEEIRREGGRGPPKVIHRLTEHVVEELNPLLEQLKIYHDIEHMLSYGIEKVKALGKEGRLTPSQATEKIMEVASHASTLLILYALVRKPLKDEDLELVATAEPIRTLKKIFSEICGVEDDKLRIKLYDAVMSELDKFKKFLKELDQPQKNSDRAQVEWFIAS